MLVGLGIVLDLHERKRLAVAALSFAQLQPAEYFPHLTILRLAMNRNEARDRVRAQGFDEGHLLFRREPRCGSSQGGGW